MFLMLLKSLRYPKELKAMYELRRRGGSSGGEKRSISALAEVLDDMPFCYAVLNRVSRSFAAVIQQLPPELRDAVCVFYLVLRGLDSIEDDTSVPIDQREELLRAFHSRHTDTSWSIKGVGDSTDYRLLLENYPKVIRAFQSLETHYQEVIMEICKEMGHGMASFLRKEVETVEDYNQYCHYVAGLVGIGLSRLFSASGVENSEIAHQEQLANSMGLFLQKTNIIRDYHEDVIAGRRFWPEEVWGNYGPELDHFLDNEALDSRYCLNHMITDALSHAADCLEYLKMIKDPHVFRFCAIPQVMAIATLSEIYDNKKVFGENVKIRKGLAAQLILETNNFQDAKDIFEKIALDIFKKIPKSDPNSHLTSAYLGRVVNKQSKIKEIELFSKHRSMSEKHAMAS